MASKKTPVSKSPPLVQRYEVHLVSLDPTAGREVRKTRPCVVISPNPMHQTGMAVVCPLTTSLHPQWAHRLQISCARKAAEIMVDQIRAVSLARFVKRIDTLSAKDAEALRDLIALLYATP
ncbi:type II toxin-antitoxin system PemK/MazF family toxin [Haloferula sp.]|uniref:type II toxin-antitoxin system PemK/MazF family toxin n=1 Tax=Haloferula sp. TaxID=2497595 RepID=UPI003C77C0C7